MESLEKGFRCAKDDMVAKAMCRARLGTVIVETAILLGFEWNIDREAVISQQSTRLALHDKGWNTGKPGSENSAGCKSCCSRSEPCFGASRGGEYPTGSSCRTMKVCGNFVERFFEDIFCGFRKSACERKRRLVTFAERW